ncbi:VWA domain-containing protein [Pendulispora rubella]|uniref:VWA domain-containing protein n=1 Tax=Pendulispora rubella TaxID=2741070 RepID=A0ABZ2KXJ8_9BACT
MVMSTAGSSLTLTGIRVEADACGGLARVKLEQHFCNPHSEPLSVTYSFPLPWDAAVSAFAFRIGERRIIGEIDRRSAARERFEAAILEGKTAARIDEERSSLFTQHLGNIPPGAEVIAELTIDQRLVWNDEGAWEWRFPLAVAPRYLGAEGRVADASAIVQAMTESQPVGAALSLRIRDALDDRKPESPSHPIQRDDDGHVTLAHASLDRDVVVRWPVAAPDVGCTLDITRAPGHENAFGLLTLVPPKVPGHRELPRDLIVLLDTSGSMSGAPLEQAKRMTAALVQTLSERDRLEMIEFSQEPRRWQEGAVAVTSDARRGALEWISRLRASGGTEMHAGIREALRPLRSESQRQVVLVTDGLIGFETEIVREILACLPGGARVHTVGVGSAVNRSLTGPAARAGRGAELILGLDEDPERAAQRLVARTAMPIVVDVEVAGTALVQCATEKIPDLLASSPVLSSLRLSAEGGSLRVCGRTTAGIWEKHLEVPPAHAPDNPAIVALFGRELVEDLEMRAAAAAVDAESSNDAIERTGLQFGIATRMTSWVAISEEKTVDPRAPMRRERIPHHVPYGMSVEGLGLRAPAMAARFLAAGPVVQRRGRLEDPAGPASRSAPRPVSWFDRLFGRKTPASVRERTLRGTRVTRVKDLLVVEVLVEGDALEWELPKEVVLFFPRNSGEPAHAKCDPRFTTTAALLQPGVSFRVAIAIDTAETRSPVRIALRMNNQNVGITLEST